MHRLRYGRFEAHILSAFEVCLCLCLDNGILHKTIGPVWYADPVLGLSERVSHSAARLRVHRFSVRYDFCRRTRSTEPASFRQQYILTHVSVISGNYNVFRFIPDNGPERFLICIGKQVVCQLKRSAPLVEWYKKQHFIDRIW